MTITNKGDLSYPIYILDKQGNKINITDCNEFTAKFYTTDKNINAVASYIDKQYTNIDDNKCIINSSDLSLMGNGVLHYEYTYSIADSSYNDNYYNACIAGDTNYYIKLNVENGGSGSTGQTGSTRAEWGNIAGNINNQTDLIQKLNTKADKADVYNKNEVDDKIDNIQTGTTVDLTNYYSKTEVDKKIDDINVPSYDDTSIKTSLSNKVDKVTGKSLLLDTEIQRLSTLNNYDDTSIKAELTNKADKSTTYTKIEVDKKIDDIDIPVYDDASIKSSLNNKVDKVEGKSLMSDSEITRLSNISNYDDTTIKNTINNKVDKVSGKGLSTNDYTTEDKNKLAGLSNYDDSSLINRIVLLENEISNTTTIINDINKLL